MVDFPLQDMLRTIPLRRSWLWKFSTSFCGSAFLPVFTDEYALTRDGHFNTKQLW